MLDARRLRLLAELSERGTISAVADALQYTPSTVSYALASLEEQVGVALLERTPRSVRLTAAGRALAADARDIVARLEAAHLEALAVGGLERGVAAVATFPSAGSTLVAPALARLRGEHPGLRLRAVEAEPHAAILALRAGDVDVAVVFFLGAEPPPTGLEVELLLEEPMLACLPPDLDVQAPAFELDDLAGLPLVAGRPGTPCENFTREACRAAGFEPDIAYETDDIAFTCSVVNAGLAAAIMPRSLICCAPEPVRALPCAALPPRRVYAARRPSSATANIVTAVVAALADEAGRQMAPTALGA